MTKKPVRIEKHPKKEPATKSFPAAEVVEKKPSEKREKRKVPVVKKWWFWLIVALLVIALTLTLACTLDYTIMSYVIRLGCAPKNVSVPAGYEDVKASTDAVYDVVYPSSYGNAFLDVFSSKTPGKKPLLVYVHGGYYLGGDKSGVEPYCRTIAAEGYIVASLNYALAPEVKYPGQEKQFNEALTYLLDNADRYDIDETQVFFGGDSAGCHLVSVMGAAYTDKALAEDIGIVPAIEGERIKGLLLVSGFFNLRNVRGTRFPFVNTAMWALTDTRAYESYYRVRELCPVETATADYPASLFLCAQDDKFLSQSKEFERTLKDLGVDTQSYYPEAEHAMGHEFARDFSLPEAAEALAIAKEFLSERTSGRVEAKIPHVVFELSTGDEIDVTLYPKYAPATVANFLRYVEEGFYDGTTFHRIVTDYVLQGGGFEREGDALTHKDTHEAIKGEFAANGFSKNTLSHVAGVISMARTAVYDSATSQFFFCAQDCTAYDGQYAAFGQVTDPEAVEILRRLTAYRLTTGGTDGMPQDNIYIVHARAYDER
ncbi:MAG: peptidylprolyl isomerase [Clostridia bacterium]|nr:peptidylprolyl isomerase [Clostridia bacterium]